MVFLSTGWIKAYIKHGFIINDLLGQCHQLSIELW
jgi:hypothetical protein